MTRPARVLAPKSDLQTIRNHDLDYWTGTVYTTNRRVWEHDDTFKKYLAHIRCMGIDMETATTFITDFHNEISTGALRSSPINR